jgi:hypothetical protein
VQRRYGLASDGSIEALTGDDKKRKGGANVDDTRSWMRCNVPAHSLFDRLHVQRTPEVAIPRRFADYGVDFDGRTLAVGERLDAAPGVELIRRC